MDAILYFLLKEEKKYDYYIFNTFFKINEMNKILKIPIDKIVLISASFILADEDPSDLTPGRTLILKTISMKYNLNFHDYVVNHYVPNKFKKLILTSKFLNLSSEK